VRIRPRYVRDRLTLQYLLTVGLVLGAYIFGAALLLYWQLTSQLYHAEIQDVETVEGLFYFLPDGVLALHEEYLNHPRDKLLLDRLMEVLTPEGQILFRNERLAGREMGGPPVSGEGQSSYDQRTIRLADGTRVQCISHLHFIDGRPLLIRLGHSTDPLMHRIAEFLGLMLLALPIALVASALAGYRVAGKALRPLKEMTLQTEQITANRLSNRIPVENPDDELGQMAGVLNGLLQRLEESFKHLERFTSDVSHELRTPLASIRSVGEVGLQKEHSAEGYRDIVGSMLEEVARLTQMVDDLLTISRADAGQTVLSRKDFPLLALTREVAGLIEILIEEKGQRVVVEGNERICVHADPSVLRHAVLNLLDNAVKYAPAGSRIRVRLKWAPAESSSSDRVAELSIEDEGPGIAPEHRARVFDRFYRIDEARTREAGGAGLGLSIAKWAVEIHGGQIGYRPADPAGSIFFIRLAAFES
jgi:heavy metal sensor kinase